MITNENSVAMDLALKISFKYAPLYSKTTINRTNFSLVDIFVS